jgi:hypothetical protein
LLYGGEPFGTADPSNNPSRYEIYIGPGKVVALQVHAATGRSGGAVIDRFIEGSSSYGSWMTYDPTTGIAVVQKSVHGGASTAQYTAIRASDHAALNDIYFDILVADDPVAIAQAPSVHVEASSDAGQVVTAGSTNLQYEDELIDTHGAWNGSVFTAPVSGVYLIRAGSQTNGSSNTATEMSISIAGKVHYGTYKAAGTSLTMEVVAAGYMSAGQTATIGEAYANYTRSTDANANRLSITRIGD